MNDTSIVLFASFASLALISGCAAQADDDAPPVDTATVAPQQECRHIMLDKGFDIEDPRYPCDHSQPSGGGGGGTGGAGTVQQDFEAHKLQACAQQRTACVAACRASKRGAALLACQNVCAQAYASCVH